MKLNYALHINFFNLNLNEFFLSICMQHTDKNYQESGFLGKFFCTVYCRMAGTSGGFAPGPPPGLCPGPTEGLMELPRQPATPGNEIPSLHLVLSVFTHALMTIWPTTLNSLKENCNTETS